MSGNSQNHFHASAPPAWCFTMSPRLRLPAAMMTPTSAKPIAISYATICAAERIAPRNAYFEFDDQPARMMPYTPADVSASTYNSAASTLAMVNPGHSGITAQVASAGINASSGANTNNT